MSSLRRFAFVHVCSTCVLAFITPVAATFPSIVDVLQIHTSYIVYTLYIGIWCEKLVDSTAALLMGCNQLVQQLLQQNRS